MTFHILKIRLLASDYLSDVPAHIAPLGGLVGGVESGATGWEVSIAHPNAREHISVSCSLN